MNPVSIRDLRNRGGEIVDRVARGEAVVITRDGVPVAQLLPLPGPALSATAVLDRWRRAPRVDPALLREELDEVVDQRL